MDECPECGRTFADLPRHRDRVHGAGEDSNPAAPNERPPDTAQETGHVVKTSHNTPNPDAPPPSYTPATANKEAS